MNIDPTVVLALISDLTTRLINAGNHIAELERQLAEKADPA